MKNDKGRDDSVVKNMHKLLFQGMWVLLSAATWWRSTIWNAKLEGVCCPLLAFFGTRHAHGTHGTKHSYT